MQTYFKHQRSSTVKNIAAKGKTPIDAIDCEPWLRLKSVTVAVASFITRFSSLQALRGNSAVQQNCHFLRESSYDLRITTYHTPVTVIPNALFTAGKKHLYKASVDVGYPQSCEASCLAYRCFYTSSAIQEESLLALLPSNANALRLPCYSYA